MTIKDAYATAIKSQKLVSDEGQKRIVEKQRIQILGREIQSLLLCKGHHLVQLFEKSVMIHDSQEDYIEIARYYHTAIVPKVPMLTPENNNATRRFIALVDEIYDRKAKLIVSAEVGVTRLYRRKHFAFEFQRTSGRSTEIQTAEYLTIPPKPDQHNQSGLTLLANKVESPA